MVDIDSIMNLLDWNRSVSEQERGVKLARDVKDIGAFIQPCNKKYNKNVWENCAKILVERTDDELTPYLIELFEWLQDMNWPGAIIIVDRLKKLHDTKMLSFAIKECEKRASATDNRIWLENLSDLMDNVKLK